ncbi:hypothetical protein [Nostoc sp.]
MLSGRGKWRSYRKSDREKAIEDILQVFLQSHPSNEQLLRFAGSIPTDDIQLIREAIEQDCEQVDTNE